MGTSDAFQIRESAYPALMPQDVMDVLCNMIVGISQPMKWCKGEGFGSFIARVLDEAQHNSALRFLRLTEMPMADCLGGEWSFSCMPAIQIFTRLAAYYPYQWRVTEGFWFFFDGVPFDPRECILWGGADGGKAGGAWYPVGNPPRGRPL